MKYFLIEGIVTNPEKMTEKMMQEHQEYTGMLMKEGIHQLMFLQIFYLQFLF